MTPSDLKTATLRKLKVIGSGQDANAADFALMGEKYEALHAILLAKSLVTWALDEDIPAKAVEAIKTMLAAFSADEFGVPEPRATILKGEGAVNLPQSSPAERLLRAVLAPKYVSSPVRSDYF